MPAFWLIGGLAFAVLLVSFQQVVSAIVRQGEAWRQVQAEQAQASRRCRVLRGRPERLDCMALLADSSRPGASRLSPPGGASQAP